MSATIRGLFLNVDIGAGHRQAAQALTQALDALCPGSEFETLEALDYLGPGAKELARDLYLGVQSELPDLWGFIYEQRDLFRFLAPLGELVDGLRAQGLRPRLDAFDPELVVATHPLACGLAGALRRGRQLHCPTAAVLTDFDAHPAWVVNGIDLYFAPDAHVASELRRLGVAPTSIVVTGIPLRAGFGEIRSTAPEHAALGLTPERFTILLLGGGLGLGPILETAAALLALEGPVQLVLIAGANQELEREAERLAAESPLPFLVVGFTEQMARYMRAADLAVGKPGGLTSAELLAAGVPLVALQPLAGQEEANCARLVEQGAARRADDAAAALRTVELLLAEPAEHQALRQAALALGRPVAARDAARALVARLKQRVEARW